MWDSIEDIIKWIGREERKKLRLIFVWVCIIILSIGLAVGLLL